MTFRFSPSICLEAAYQQYLPLTNFPLAEAWCSNIELPTKRAVDIAKFNTDAGHSRITDDFFCPITESKCDLLSSLKDQDPTFARATCCCIGVCLELRTTTIVTIPTTPSSAEKPSTDIKSDNTRTFTENHSTRPRIDPTTQIQHTNEPQPSSTSNVATGTETDSDVASSTFSLPSSAIRTSTIFRTRSRDATLPTGPTFSDSASSSLGTESSSSASSPSSADPSSISFRISSASIALSSASGIPSSSDSLSSNASPSSTSTEQTIADAASVSSSSASAVIISTTLLSSASTTSSPAISSSDTSINSDISSSDISSTSFKSTVIDATSISSSSASAIITFTALLSSLSTTPSPAISSSGTSISSGISSSDTSSTSISSTSASSTCTALRPDHSTTYTQYYSGQSYIEDLDNPGNSNNTQYPAIYTSYSDVLDDMCTVALECATKASTENGGYPSFDLHYLSNNGSWVCVQFVDANSDESYFDVRDRDVDVAHGFSTI